MVTPKIRSRKGRAGFSLDLLVRRVYMKGEQLNLTNPIGAVYILEATAMVMLERVLQNANPLIRDLSSGMTLQERQTSRILSFME